MQVPETYPDRHVCIIGLGYVGLTLSVALCEAGYRVYGVEHNDAIVETVRRGRAHFRENGLDARLHEQVRKGALTVSRAVEASDQVSVYIITVGTPLLPGAKTTQHESIETVSAAVASVMRAGDLVILRSTVSIGVSRGVVVPLLDETAVPYHLAFCPERTLEGRALEELSTLPQIVGGLDEGSTVRAAQLFSFLTPTTIKVSSLEAAELIKLVNNTQRDLMFAFSNEVAQICDNVGVNAAEVIKAGNMGYARSTVPMPGPVGGPCLEKDPYILAEGAGFGSGHSLLSLTGRRLNEALPLYAVDRIVDHWRDRDGVPAAPRIAIFGLAFKGRPETSDLRGTMAVPLIAALRLRIPDAVIVGFDPAVDPDEATVLGIDIARSPDAALQDADVCILQTNHPSFETMRLEDVARPMRERGLIYDFWNQFVPNQHHLNGSVSYASLGGWCWLT